jgi:DNA-binding PadR family transcriptional regulator
MNHPRLSEREIETMLTIIRCGANAYGPAIRDAITERTGEQPSFGALYSVLDRLLQKSLVETRMGEPTPERGGKRKRFYRLNGAGQVALQHALVVQDRLREGIALPELALGGVIA